MAGEESGYGRESGSESSSTRDLPDSEWPESGHDSGTSGLGGQSAKTEEEIEFDFELAESSLAGAFAEILGQVDSVARDETPDSGASIEDGPADRGAHPVPDSDG
jgi:hypothetical protein